MALTSASTLAFAMLALLAGVVSAQSTTTGTRFGGYSYSGDVIGYVNMYLDACQIEAAVATNISEATDIYLNGRNSRSGIALRKFLTWSSHVPTEGTIEPGYVKLTGSKDPLWLDMLIREAISKGDVVGTQAYITVAYIKYMIHELDAASLRVQAYLANDTLIANLDEARGAPHNLDEAWALYSSGSSDACFSAWLWAEWLAKDLGTSYMGLSNVNAAVTLAFNDIQWSIRKADIVGLQDAYDRIMKNIIVLGVQGVTRSLYAAHVAYRCKRADDVMEQQTLARAHLSYLIPLLDVSEATTMKLMTAAGATKPNYKNAKPLISAMIKKLGLTWGEVGIPNFTAIAGEWKCKAYTKP